MDCWKHNFSNKALKDGVKYKNDVADIDYDGYTLKANVKSFNVELIMQDNILYDFSCSCSKKSPCAHEASVLYFFEEFPEILEDLCKKDYDITKISKINVNDDLKVISLNKLNKFLKKEFKKNPKLKYNFIQYFSEESLIDEKTYEKKLGSILTGKRHGYYDLSSIGSNIKKFMKKDILVVVEQGEYELAYKLLIKIMDIFIDQLYWDQNHWYDIAYYYREYAYILFKSGKLSNSEKNHMKDHLRDINNIVF